MVMNRLKVLVYSIRPINTFFILQSRKMTQNKKVPYTNIMFVYNFIQLNLTKSSILNQQKSAKIMRLYFLDQLSPFELFVLLEIYIQFKKYLNPMDIEKSFQELLEEKNAKIKDAQQNFGETQIRDALLAKAELYNDHTKLTQAIETFNLALKRTIEIGKKMDIAFKLIAIYLKLGNNIKIKENIDECYKLLEKGGDWERKNKLKVYEGVYRLIIRDFQAASKLFVDVLPTFNCPEIMTYEKLVTYSVLTGILNMNRVNIKKKILQSSEAIAYLMKLPDIKDYIESFYHCRYRQFFTVFVKIIELVKKDPFIRLHVRYFIRETRVVIYSQFLESYKTVKLESMANEFGVSLDFIDRELSQLISARRLPCKIDKVSGIIQTDPTDERNRLYKNALKKGDHLLNQIQRLSRAIDL